MELEVDIVNGIAESRRGMDKEISSKFSHFPPIQSIQKSMWKHYAACLLNTHDNLSS